MSKSKIGLHIRAFGKSKHAGQSGTIVADYENMLLVLADDQSYDGAHPNTAQEGKCFQVDSRFYKVLKASND